jgi:hypothetical protein
LRKVAKEFKTSVSPLQDNPAGGPDAELLPAGFADAGLVPAQMVNAMQSFEQERVAFQTDLRLTYTLNALTSIARALSGYPGRKNLIWISEAFPLSIDPNLELTGDTFAGTRNYGPQIAEAADSLIDARTGAVCNVRRFQQWPRQVRPFHVTTRQNGFGHQC